MEGDIFYKASRTRFAHASHCREDAGTYSPILSRFSRISGETECTMCLEVMQCLGYGSDIFCKFVLIFGLSLDKQSR